MEIDPPSTPSTRSRSSVLSLISTFLCHPRLRKSRSHADVLNHEGASDGRKSKLSSEKSPRPSAGLARPVSALLSSNYTTSHPTPQTHYHTAHDPNADVFPTSHPQGRFSPLPPTPFSGFPKAPSSSSLNNINTSNAYGARGTSPERRYGSPASYKAGAGGGYFGSDEGGGGEVREGYNEEAYDTSDDPRRHRKAELDNLSLAEVESVIHASRTRSETGDHVRQILSRTGSLARSVDSFGFVPGAGLGRNDSNPRSILGRNSSLPSRDSHGVHGHAGQTSLGRNGSMPRSDLGRSKSGKSGAEESISEESEVVFVPRKDKGKAKALDQDAVDGFSFENENPNPNSLQALVREEEVHTDHSAFTSPDASPAVGATVPLPISTKPTPVLPTTNSNGNVTTVPSPTSLPKLQTALPVPASAPASAISPSVSIRRLPPEPNAPSKVSTPIQPSPMRALPNPNGPSTAQVYERALSPAISSFSHTSSSQPYPLAHDDGPSPPPRMPSLLSQYQHSHSHSQSQSLSHSHSRASSTTGSRRMLPSPPPMPSTTPFSTSSHGSSYGNGGGHSTSLSQSFSAFSPSPLSNGPVGGANGFVRTDLARDDYDPRMRDNLMSSPVYPRPVQGRGVAPEVQDY